MGSVVLKLTPDRDAYVIWSSVVDDITHGPGTREQVIHHLLHEARVPYTDRADAEAVVARADLFGSSDRAIGFGRWDDDDLDAGPRGDGWYNLSRARLAEYADALDRGDDAAARACLVCWQRFDEDD